MPCSLTPESARNKAHVVLVPPSSPKPRSSVPGLVPSQCQKATRGPVWLRPLRLSHPPTRARQRRRRPAPPRPNKDGHPDHPYAKVKQDDIPYHRP